MSWLSGRLLPSREGSAMPSTGSAIPEGLVKLSDEAQSVGSNRPTCGGFTHFFSKPENSFYRSGRNSLSFKVKATFTQTESVRGTAFPQTGSRRPMPTHDTGSVHQRHQGAGLFSQSNVKLKMLNASIVVSF